MESDKPVKSGIQYVFRPYLVFARIVGHTYVSNCVSLAERKKCWMTITKSFLYSAVLNLLYVTNVVLLIPCVFSWTKHIGTNLTRLLNLLFNLLTAVVATNSFLTLPKLIPKFIYHVDSLNGIVQCPKRMKKCRRFVIITTILMGLHFPVIIAAGLWYILTIPRPSWDDTCLGSPFVISSPYALPMGVTRSIISNLAGVGVDMIVFFVWLFVIIIKDEMLVFKEKLDKLLLTEANDKAVTFEDIDSLNLTYKTIVKLSETANGMLKTTIGAYYATVVPCVCVLIFSISTNTLKTETLMGNAILFVVVLALTVVITVSASFVHERGQTLYSHAAQFTMATMDARTISLLNVLLNRLRAGEIGFTALDFFVVNRESALMLIGTVVTYAVIVFQFQPYVATLPSTTQMPFNTTF